MSTQGTVVDFLRTIEPGDGGVIPLTPESLSMQTGVGNASLRRTLYSLKQQGKIDFTKDDRGREITGIKVIDLTPGKPGRKPGSPNKHERMRLVEPRIVNSAPRRRNGIQTPNLDQYAKAKATFASLSSEWGQWGTAEFNENAVAEEGLILLARLHSTEEQFIDLRHEFETLQDDYKALQAKKRQKLAQRVADSGTMVINSD